MSFLKPFKAAPHYMPSEIAAGYIEAFVNGTLRDPYSWDDFELSEHSNPEINTALFLCGWAVKHHPPRNDHEYMAPTAAPYFLRIAKLLRNGELKPFVSVDQQAILAGNIPTELRDLLEPKSGETSS
jgi:hypothetical protein